ncbi:MAG: hypothetical protein V3T63_05225 [Nitrosopumilaceae archaeon]
MNKAAIAGIIAVVAIGIGIALAFSSGILETSTTTEETEDLPTQTEQPKGDEFSITLKEEIGIEAKP